MERENKKREREEPEVKPLMDVDNQPSRTKEAEPSRKKGKQTDDIADTYPEDMLGDISKISDGCHSLGVFEFPWRDEGLVLQSDDDAWDLRRVFFSSLVDGRSAAIGFPGERLSYSSTTSILIEDESDVEDPGRPMGTRTAEVASGAAPSATPSPPPLPAHSCF